MAYLNIQLIYKPLIPPRKSVLVEELLLINLGNKDHYPVLNKVKTTLWKKKTLQKMADNSYMPPKTYQGRNLSSFQIYFFTCIVFPFKLLIMIALLTEESLLRQSSLPHGQRRPDKFRKRTLFSESYDDIILETY